MEGTICPTTVLVLRSPIVTGNRTLAHLYLEVATETLLTGKVKTSKLVGGTRIVIDNLQVCTVNRFLVRGKVETETKPRLIKDTTASKKIEWRAGVKM